MNELSASKVNIQDLFWTPRLLTNAQIAIFHQWKQLEESHCIDNFRLAAGQKEGFREGWFFSDSDAYKWLDAAARIQTSWPSDNLKKLMDELICLLGNAQMEDGYIYTYNQIHFPSERWGNLMIEHELYCHGHLIEAGISHFQATGEDSALRIARKAADLLVSKFLIASPDKTSGHEEVEIALLRLYQFTGHDDYLELARQFLERRGKIHPFAWHLLQQNVRVSKRRKLVDEQRKVYLHNHPEHASFQLPLDNYAKKAYFAKLRWAFNTLTGKYFQQHAPIRKQTIPVGHSVRFAYLETAIAMLQRLTGDLTLMPPLQKSWDHMVSRRMYITGGIGSLPEIEGFGRDDELDPEYAYAETCAALGSLFWNWEMALNTGDACYSDLFEWQLYNAAAVGMGLDGDSYLYNNPLLCRGGVTRHAWFLVPCCPSNLSRTWASLGKYIYSFDENNLWIHQYIGNQSVVNESRWIVKIDSTFPWDGKTCLTLGKVTSSQFTIHFRLPSWAKGVAIWINGEKIATEKTNVSQNSTDFASYCGYDPRLSKFISVTRSWSSEDTVELNFEMPVMVRRASPRLHGHKGKVCLTRGPLVYCLESIDNPGIDIFKVRIDPGSIHAAFSPALLGGIWVLRGKTMNGEEVTAIPYLLWANRGESQMTVWMNT